MSSAATVPELAFTEAGSGTTIVLLHAFPLDNRMWDEVADGLAETAHVVRIDLPGFGGSPLPDGEPTLDGAADAVVAVLDGIGIGRAVVAGLSMGGYVALAVTERHVERLAGLGLLNTKASADSEDARRKRLDLAAAVRGSAGARALHGLTDSLVAEVTRNGRPQVVSDVQAMIDRADPRAVAWGALAMAARPDRQALLDALEVPSLVLVGEHDAVTPEDDARAMAARLGVEPVVVPSAGHLTAMEEPGAVTAALADLVRRCR